MKAKTDSHGLLRRQNRMSEAPSCETLPQGGDRLRFDDVEGFDLQLAVKSRLVDEGL